jgi:poly(A) polymerase
MLRAVRFRWQLDFELAPGLREAIQSSRERLRIISFERIRDELVKMLTRPSGPNALQDLMDTGLLEIFAPELVAMKGVDQGSYHHLDVWEHTLLAMRNLWEGVEQPGLSLVLGVLFHDIGKPPTRAIDPEGKIRFFGHEAIGAEMTRQVLRRLKFAERDIEPVARLVKNHMRLGSSPTFTPSAARRLLRDLGDQVDELLELVSADASALKPGIRKLDLAPIRSQLAQVQLETPRSALESPLSGEEIMEIKQIAPGLEVGKWKRFLTEKVLDGELAPGDKEAARQLLETSKF